MDFLRDEAGGNLLDEAEAPVTEEYGGTYARAAVGRSGEVPLSLMPVALGDTQAKDVAIEGDHLDAAQSQAELLAKEMFVDNTFAGLADWERVLGLPDACTGQLPTVAQRIEAAAAKFSERRRISTAHLIDAAARHGYAITITQYAARRYGQAELGGDYFGKEWANTITVTAPANTVRERTYGAAVLGEDYRVWGNDALECLILRLRPAHVYVVFAYAS